MPGESASEPVSNTRQTTISRRSNAVQGVEAAGIEPRPGASWTRALRRVRRRNRGTQSPSSPRGSARRRVAGARIPPANSVTRIVHQHDGSARLANTSARPTNRMSRDFERTSVSPYATHQYCFLAWVSTRPLWTQPALIVPRQVHRELAAFESGTIGTDRSVSERPQFDPRW